MPKLCGTNSNVSLAADKNGTASLTHSTRWSRRSCALCSSPWRWPWHRPISLTRYRALICQPQHANHPPAPPTDNVVTTASAHTSCTHTHTHTPCRTPSVFCAHRRDAQLLHCCWHQHSHPFAPWTTCFFRASGVHSPLTRVRESRDRICSETGSIRAQMVVLGEHTLLCAPACVCAEVGLRVCTCVAPVIAWMCVVAS